MKSIIWLFFLLISITCFSQEMDYNVANISPELKKNAISVVRMDQQTLRITDVDNASIEVKYAVTIFDENAYDRAIFAKAYDKFIKLKNIKISIYDGSGNLAKKLKNDDIIDASLSVDAGEMVDNRMKYADPDYKFFPFTIEYSYGMSFNGFMSFPSWSPYGDYEEGVENASLEVAVKDGYQLKYLEKNGAPKAMVTKIGNENVYSWKLSKLPAIKQEPFTDLSSTFPTVLLSPVNFKMDGYEGNNTSWDEFGEWIAKLNSDRNNLSPEAISKINSLISNIPNKRGKVEALYNHLQNKTRYVSIQLGIGGWQPFEADKVDRLGYGDCKALTNYMKSILEVADIPSYYVLARAGENEPDINTDFPSNQFNHAFLMVPMDQDTAWLECTSQHVPFGMMGSFTDDRHVLVIKEDGGSIVKTPEYTCDQNYQSRIATVSLLENGEAKAKVQTKYGGARFMDEFPNFIREKEDVKKALYREIDIHDFTINDYNVSQENDQTLSEELNLNIHSFAKKSQQNLIVPLNLMNKVSKVPPRNEARNSDVFMRRSFREEDLVTYQLPPGYAIGSQPDEIAIDSKFGTYKVSVSNQGRIMEYKRILTVNKGTFPATDYESLVDFISQIAKADRMKVLLVKK